MKNTQTDKAEEIIRVSKNVHKELFLFKIRCNAKNMNEAMKEVIKRLRETKQWKAK